MEACFFKYKVARKRYAISSLFTFFAVLAGSGPAMSDFVQFQSQPAFRTPGSNQSKLAIAATSQEPSYQPVQSELNGVAGSPAKSNTMHKVNL